MHVVRVRLVPENMKPQVINYRPFHCVSSVVVLCNLLFVSVLLTFHLVFVQSISSPV